MSDELRAHPTHHSSLITHHSPRLLLVRHGQTVWNLQGRYQGRTDVPLTLDGQRQAAALAAQLRAEPIAAVYSSTLQRAYDTARPIAASHGLPVVRDERLNEINQGEWEGLHVSEIARGWPALFAQWERDPLAVRLPGGETLQEVQARVLAVLQEIARAWPRQTVCIVAHKVTVAAIRCWATARPVAEGLEAMPANGRQVAGPVRPDRGAARGGGRGKLVAHDRRGYHLEVKELEDFERPPMNTLPEYQERHTLVMSDER